MKYVKLNTLCDINIGKTPSRSKQEYWGLGGKWISIADIKSTYITDTKEQITPLGIDQSKIKLVPKDTVIMSFKLTVGKVAITAEDMYTNEAIASFPIKDNSKLYTKYLYYCLQTLNLMPATDRAVMGATLNKAKLNEIKIPYVDYDQQIKIANILDQAQELIDKRKAQIEALDELIQSVFHEMFGDVNSNDKNWNKIEVEKTCKTILGGGTPSTKNKEYFIGDIPWVTPKDMKSLRIRESIININQEAIQNSSAKLIPQGSVLMVIRSGILKRMLPVAINDCEVAVNQDMKAFIPNGEIINAIYLLFYFKSIQGILLSRVRSVTADNLEFNTIKKHLIAIPPIELQNQFAEMVENIEKQKGLLNESLVELENNFNSLMQRAFNGGSLR